MQATLSAQLQQIIDAVLPSITELSYLLNDGDVLDAQLCIKFFQEVVAEQSVMREEYILHCAQEGKLGNLLASYIHQSAIGYSAKISWKEAGSGLNWLQEISKIESIPISLKALNINTDLDLNEVFKVVAQPLKQAGYILVGLETDAVDNISMLISEVQFKKFSMICQQLNITLVNYV